ncbi:MAG: NACHT domain-containing protein [Lachnospiraceae bacterium]
MILKDVYVFLEEQLGNLAVSSTETALRICWKGKGNVLDKIDRLFWGESVSEEIKPKKSTNENPTNYSDGVSNLFDKGVMETKNKSATLALNIMKRMAEDIEHEEKYIEEMIDNSLCLKIREINGCDDKDKATITKVKIENVKKEYEHNLNREKRQFEKETDTWFKNNGLSSEKELSAAQMITIMILKCLCALKATENVEYAPKRKRKEIEDYQGKLQNIISEHYLCEGETDFLDKYYVDLWEKNRYIEWRDGDGSLDQEWPMADLFILPKFLKNEENKEKEEIVVHPFKDSQWNYVVAESGAGKTTMLRSIVTSCISDYIIQYHKDEYFSDEEEKNTSKEKFEDIYECYFGKDIHSKESDSSDESTGQKPLPVYIEAKAFNDNPDASIVSLAVGYNKSVIRSVEEKQLLFLIDALDEVEAQYLNVFYGKLYKMMKEYPKSQFIITTRFAGRNLEVDHMQCVHLCEFGEEQISEYLSKRFFLTPETIEKIESFLKGNPYAMHLAKNPYNLCVIIDCKNDLSVKKCLDKIVDSIIERRFYKMRVYEMNQGMIRGILGYLAFHIVFEENDDKRKDDERKHGIRKSELGSKLRKLSENKLLRESCNVYEELTDRQIALFVNHLSSQSGLINVKLWNKEVFYCFQDDLVCAFLAAEFIMKTIDGEGSIFHDDDTIHLGRGRALFENIWEIDRVVSKFAEKRKVSRITDQMMQVVNFLFVMSDQETTKALVYYLLFSGFLNVNDPEKQGHIQKCFREMQEKMFAENISITQVPELENINTLIERYFRVIDDE